MPVNKRINNVGTLTFGLLTVHVTFSTEKKGGSWGIQFFIRSKCSLMKIGERGGRGEEKKWATVPLPLPNINNNDNHLAMWCAHYQISEKCLNCCKIKKRKFFIKESDPYQFFKTYAGCHTKAALHVQ